MAVTDRGPEVRRLLDFHGLADVTPTAHIRMMVKKTAGRQTIKRRFWIGVAMAILGCGGADDPLVDALDRTRLIRPRLVGNFPAVPCHPRSPQSVTLHRMRCDVSLEELDRVHGKMLAVASDNGGHFSNPSVAGDRQFSARWILLSAGDSIDATDAIGLLEGAVALDPEDAGVRSDLAAAYLIRADADTSVDDLIRAFLSAEAAIESDSLLAEAHFNRALAFESLTLYTRASEAWDRYAKIEPDPTWRTLARGRWIPPSAGRTEVAFTAVLDSALVAGELDVVDSLAALNPLEVYEHAVRVVMPDWATAITAGRLSDADSLLGLALQMANSVTRYTGDRLLRDAIEVAEVAPADLATGMSALATAWSAFPNVDATVGALDVALPALIGARSPLQFDAEFLLGAALYVRREYDEAIAQINDLRDRLDRERHGILVGRTSYVIGLIRSVQGRHGDAVPYFEDALRELPAADFVFRSRSYTELSAQYTRLGTEAQAERYFLPALLSQSTALNAGSSYLLLITLGDYALRRFGPRSAVPFHEENLARQDPADLAESSEILLRIAEMNTGTGQLELALSYVDRAVTMVLQIESEEIRTERESFAMLLRGEILARLRPTEAVESLEEAVREHRRTEHFTRMVRAEVALARAHVATGSYDAGLESFLSALAELDRQRAALDSAHHRRNYFDRARPVFDELVTFQIDRGEYLVALSLFERMRGRVILDQLDVAEPAPLDGPGVEEVKARLAGRTLLSFAVLPDRVVAWVFTDKGVETHITPVSAATLRTLVRNYLAALERGDALASTHGATLYDLLVRPAVSAGAGGGLIVVPDDYLHLLPFGSLVDSTTGEYVIERGEVTIVPSVAAFRTAPRGPAAPRLGRRVVVVGNPAFDQRLFGLPDLPASRAEAEDVHRQWSGAELLVEQEATLDRFRQTMVDADLIHFAGHAVANPINPNDAYLILSSDDGGTRWYAAQIAELRLSAAPIVVLSACQTGAGMLSASEGPTSLAKAFLVAGSSGVVASLWPVEDELTAQFFVSFHQRLRQGMAPAAALAATQTEFIGIGRTDPRWRRVWSAFQLYGTG